MALKKITELPEKLRADNDDLILISDSAETATDATRSKKVKAKNLGSYIFSKTFSPEDFSLSQINNSGNDPAILRSGTGENTFWKFAGSDTNNSITFRIFNSWDAVVTPSPGFLTAQVFGGMSILCSEPAELSCQLNLQKSLDSGSSWQDVVSASARLFTSYTPTQGVVGGATITPTKDSARAKYFLSNLGRFNKTGTIAPANQNIVGLEVNLRRDGNDDVIVYGAQNFLDTITKVEINGIKSSSIHRAATRFGATQVFQKSFSFAQDYDISASAFKFNYDISAREDVLGPDQDAPQNKTELAGGQLSFRRSFLAAPFAAENKLRWTMQLATFFPRHTLSIPPAPAGKNVEFKIGNFGVQIFQEK